MNKTFSISEAISFGWNTFKSNWKFWVMVWLLMGMGSGFNSGSFGSAGEKIENFGKDNYMQEQEITMPAELSMPMENMEYDTPVVEDNISIPVLESLPAGVLGDFDEKGENGWVWLIVAPVIAIIVVGLFGLMLLSVLIQTIFNMGHINITLDAVRGKKLYYKTLLNHVSLKKAFRFVVASFVSGLITVFGFIFFIIPGFYFLLKYIFVPFVIVDKDTSPMEALKVSGELTKGVKFQLLGLGFSFFGLGILGLLALGVGAIVVGIVASISLAYVYVKLNDGVSEAVPSIQ